jgi:hypothetical protein
VPGTNDSQAATDPVNTQDVPNEVDVGGDCFCISIQTHKVANFEKPLLSVSL